jgi:hypothetical protein
LIKINISFFQACILLTALLLCPVKIAARDIFRVPHHKRISVSYTKLDSSLIKKKQVDTNNLIVQDSLKTEMRLSDSAKITKERYPQKATIYSALLPGLGQAYNHKYWKIPIIYVGGAAIYYFIDYCNTQYKDAKKIYEEEILKGPQGNQNIINYASANRDYFRKWRDLDVIFMGLLYSLNIIDAMADAYFTKFDISDNLTMKITPSMIAAPTTKPDNYSIGLKLSFRF